MPSPYDCLDEKAIWRLAVAQKAPLSFDKVYTKKFDISKTDKIVTAGSCFAQHIAKRLALSGFQYMDYEPAPVNFPENLRPKFNYGVYSARYCNIYTVRQLLQLFERVYGLREPIEDFWESKDGIHDPFRPAVEPIPFSSMEDFELSRRSHFTSVKKVFEQSSLFIFTLGLTESWEDRRDGTVYPVCPGTAAGVFDSDKYVFRNHTHAEILSDFRRFKRLLNEVNPDIRFLLTVSPVPLVATASGDHVLPATVYSKSVLRAVAGQLCHENAEIDYFPSYEIVAAHPSKSIHFEENLRSVKTSGVDYVMTHFFKEHLSQATDENAPNQLPTKAIQASADADDVICEEMFLDKKQ